MGDPYRESDRVDERLVRLRRSHARILQVGSFFVAAGVTFILMCEAVTLLATITRSGLGSCGLYGNGWGLIVLVLLSSIPASLLVGFATGHATYRTAKTQGEPNSVSESVVSCPELAVLAPRRRNIAGNTTIAASRQLTSPTTAIAPKLRIAWLCERSSAR